MALIASTVLRPQLIVAIIAALIAPTLARAGCPRYQVETIPGPDCKFTYPQSSANALSESGELCGGYSTCNESGFGAVWLGKDPWVPLLLPPDVEWIAPQDINSSRQMAAYIPEPSNPEVIRRAAYYDFNSSTLIDIGHLPGDSESESYAINESSAVCGYSANNITGPGRSFIWQNGQMSALSLPLGPNSVAYDIAETGAICGWMGGSPHTNAHAFVWSNGRTIDLGVVAGSLGAEARGISGDGTIVVGRVIFSDPDPKIGYQKRAYLWHKGRAENLGLLPGYVESIAYDVNDSGIAIGKCMMQNSVGPAFVWRNGVMTALNDIVPAGLNMTIDRVLGINSAGQIAGSAHPLSAQGVPQPEQIAVRLTPFQPPAGDCDCNGHVGIQDLLNTISQWGPAIPTTTADFDNSGAVNIYDLLIVISNWD